MTLTSRQREIVECLTERDMGYKQTAEALGLTIHAIDYHMRQLREITGARTNYRALYLITTETRSHLEADELLEHSNITS